MQIPHAVKLISCVMVRVSVWCEKLWCFQLQVTVEERASMATLASALVALSQGVVFFHAGDEILRSKSLDRDSYSSGTSDPPTSQYQTLHTFRDGLVNIIILGLLFEP